MSSVRSTAQHSNVKWPSSGASWQSQQLGYTENWQQKPMKGSGKSHSWWWDSHISPKNSKWLEDNLNAMDAKVKAMLKLIEEDADSFAKRAEMYYKKRPELVSLVEEFYRSYRSLAERYDQLTGDIRKNVPHDMQAQFGLSGDSSPGSPFASNVRRRAAGFNVFASPGTPTRSQESFDDKEVGESVSSRQQSGYDESSSSSSSESEHETNSRKKRQEELRELRKENDQLMKDLHNGTAEHNALLKRVNNLQAEINTLKQENSRLQEGTSAAASRANMLRDEVENLQKGNAALGHEVALRVDQLEKLQKDLNHSQEEERRLLKQLDEVSLREQNSEIKINQLTEELRALSVELDKLQQAKSDLTNEVSTGVEHVLKLKDEVKWLQEALSRSDSEKVKSIALQELLQKQHEDLEMQVSALQEEKKEILSGADKVRSLEEQLEQLQGCLLSSEGEKLKGLELLREMEVAFERLQNEFSTMQESLNGQISMHVSGKRDLQDQLQQHLEALTSLQNEKSRSVDFQEVLQKRLGDMQQERDLAKDETCKLRDEMVALMERLEGEILSRDKLVNHLNDQLSTKQDEYQILEKQMEASAEEIKIFQGAVQKLQNSLNNSQKENQILESKLQVTLEGSSKFTEEVTEMRRLIETMKGEQAAADAYRQNVDHDIEMLMREKTGLTEERLLNVDHINKLGQELQGMIGKLEEKERVVLEVESEVRRLQETNLRMESELSSKMEHAQQLELRIQRLQDVVDLTQVANTKLSSDLQESLAEMQSAEERCRQQEQMLLQLQEERMQLSVEMEDIRTREKGLQGERDLLLVEKSKLKAQVNEFKQLVARLQDEIQVLRNQNEDLRIKVQRHTETEQVLGVDIQKLRDELFNLQHVGEDKMRLLVMQISQLKEEIYRLELQSTDSSARLKLLGEEQESWNQERSRLHNEIDNLTEENRQLRCTLLERTDHHQKLETEHNDLKKRTRMVEDSLVFYRTENDRSQADIAAKVARILRLEQELSMMENSLSASQENIKNLSFQFENEIQELNDRLRAEIEKVQLLGEDTQKLQEALLNAQKETQMVKDACKQHLMEFKLTEESMESQIVKLTNGIGLLEDESKELDKRLQDKWKQQEALELDIENLQGALLRTTEERESVKAECDRQLKELVEERENRTRLEEANANLQIETKDLYVEIAQLQAQLHWMHGKIEELKKRGEAAVDQERKVELEIYSLLLALKNAQVENGSFRDEYNGYMEELRLKHLSLKSIEESIQSLLQERSQSKQDGVLHSGRMKEELDRGLERAGQPVESYIRRDKDNILWKELQALQSQIPALEQQLESLEEKKSKVREQFFVHLKHSDAASSVLQREKKELHEKLLIEGDRVLKLQEELSLIREEDDKSKMGIDAANLQIQKLLRDLQELQKTLQRKEQQEKELKDELESHVQEHLKVVNGLNEAQIALSLERAECWNLRDQMALKDQEARKLEEEIALLKEHFAKFEEEKDTLVGEKERVFKQMKDFERKTEELQEELLMLREQRKCLEEKLEAELVHIIAFEEESSNWQQEKDSLTSHITVHVNKTVKLLEQIGQVTEEKEKLSGQLQDSESIIESLIEESNVVSQKYETVEKELKNLQMQLAHLQDENRRLGQDVSLRTASIAELKDIVSCLEKEKSEIESEVQIKQEHVLILEERIGGLQEENEQLKQKLISGTEQMQILHEEISKLQQLHVNLQSEHETLKHDKQRDFDEYSMMVMRLEKVQQDLSLQQTDNTRLKAELAEGAARIEELEAKICQHQMEKQARSVEIASTASLMNDLQSKYDSLQEHFSQVKHDVESGKEELQKKNEEIQKLLSLQESLREENKGLSEELERKIKDYRIVEDTLRGLQEEHRSLQDRNQELSEEVASGGRLIDRLKQEAEQLRADREARDHEVLLKEDQIHHLQKGTHMLQQSEEQLRHLVQGKYQEIQGLVEEIQRLNDALFSTQEKSSKEKVRLETEVKKLEADVSGLRGEKVTLGDEYKLSIDRCNVELEQLSKRLQQELVEHQEDRTRLEAEVEELKERTKVLGDGITSKQGELDSMQSTNEHLNDSVSELKGEIRNLQTELSNLQNEHRSLETQLSSKLLLVQELEVALSSLKEKVVVFEEGTAVAIGDVFAVQDEVTKLIQRITRLNEQATQGETLLDEERKKSSEMLANVTNLQQELAFLREENKRQRTVIFDRGEEKREAIRQLCITLEFYQEKNRRLEGVISSTREKIQKRVAVGRSS